MKKLIVAILTLTFSLAFSLAIFGAVAAEAAHHHRPRSAPFGTTPASVTGAEARNQ